MKGYITTAVLLAVMALSTTFANAGIIVAGKSSLGDPQPCTEEKDPGFTGIIVAGFTGALEYATTGIIVAGKTGIIVAGKTGIIVAGKSGANETCGIIVAG